ncbi:phage portal protein [Candidatus Pacearchaeota archaeon]|jgi:HK97 family phage portal protein|nr:phage portal protein [Candidatus Pacearchaeota archaeon]|tara:strand:- start:962 stop:2230 length:1269 start_codon:yes stop_codon:yes gene_type:complete
MGFLTFISDWIDPPSVEPTAVAPAVPVQAYSVIDLASDAGLEDFLRNGSGNLAGATMNRKTVMRNTAVKRSVNLISNVMGMLPLHLLQKADGGDDKKARDHALFEILADKTNTQQDAFQFRRLVQRWALVDGNGYAEVLRSRGRITGLMPIHPSKVQKRENWGDPYKVNNSNGGTRVIAPENMFHLMGDSDDGLNGISLLDEAADALGLALQADKAAARLFKHGALIRDVLSKEGKLSPEAIANLKASLGDEYGGSDNANRTLVLEEGLKYQSVQANAKDSQHLETRDHQIEEIARVFGMPRPFLMMDDTSWGSGIEQLGIYFTTYTLAPWLKAWESAISRILLTNEERRSGLYPKFNERALLRGSMADQAEFFSKMMGSGGSPQIMEQNEARALLDLPEHPEGSGLNSGAVNGGGDNAPTE